MVFEGYLQLKRRDSGFDIYIKGSELGAIEQYQVGNFTEVIEKYLKWKDEVSEGGKLLFSKLDLDLRCNVSKTERQVLEGIVSMHNELVMRQKKHAVMFELAGMSDKAFCEAVKNSSTDRSKIIYQIDNLVN